MAVKSLSKMRNEAQEALLKRTQENYESRDSTGKFAGYINPELNVPTWNANEDEHLIDIVPYITSERNPDVRLRGGEIAYVLIVFVHYGVGPADAAVVCPLRNYGKRCPLCEEQKKLKEQGFEWDSPEVKNLEPKKRCLYNILCYDPKYEDKGILVWEVAHWNFERHIVELAQKPRGGGYIPFSDPNVGKAIKFKRTGKGATDTKYLGHALVDREYKIPDEDLDSTYCLEDLIIVHDFETIFNMWKPDEPVQSERQAPARRAAEEPSQERPTSGRRERPAPSHSDSARERAGSKQEPEPEQAASRRERRKIGGEDVPASVENKCPAKSGVFGQDFDKLDKCNTCDIWDDCSAEAERMEQAEKEQRASGRFSRGRS